VAATIAHLDRYASRTQRKPAFPVELSGVLALRAATRYRRQ
jgi:hypothetical protein